MKLREKLKQELIGLSRIKSETRVDIERRYISDLESAKNGKDLTRAKRQFVLSLLSYLPLADLDCYFCLDLQDRKIMVDKLSLDCSQCEYGKIHGACNSANSDWRKVKVAIDRLKWAIDKAYPDEDYPDQPKGKKK